MLLFGPKWAYLMIKVHTKNLPQYWAITHNTQANSHWIVTELYTMSDVPQWIFFCRLILHFYSLTCLPPKFFCGRLMIATRKSTSKVCGVFIPFSVWARTTWALGRTFVTFPSSFFHYCSPRIESGRTRITLLLPLPNYMLVCRETLNESEVILHKIAVCKIFDIAFWLISPTLNVVSNVYFSLSGKDSLNSEKFLSSHGNPVVKRGQ